MERTYGGRRFLAAFLWLLFPLCVISAVMGVFLRDWMAVTFMGLPSAIAAYVCLSVAWGESVALVQIQTAGIVMRLPRYRGFLPFLGLQRLAASWEDITGIWQWRVRSRFLFFPTDYVLHRVVAKRGAAILIEPLRSSMIAKPSDASQNLPVSEILQTLRTRAELTPWFVGDVNGHGLLHGLLLGGPRPQRDTWATDRNQTVVK